MTMKTKPKVEIGTPAFRRLLRESHKRQFNGEDYQGVAIDLSEENGITFEDDEHTELMSAPDPGCDCGFCATADWQD